MAEICTTDWPGKSFDGCTPDTHPALWHMLDVAAVAGILLAQRSLTGNAAQDRALQFLIALHDLGKFSESFRAMLRGQPGSGARHWRHSYTLMNYLLDDKIAALIGGDEAMRTVLYAAVAGHHGGPPEDLDRRELFNHKAQIGAGRDAAMTAISDLAPLFEGASLEELQDADALSWALSGLTVQADWIGSNAAWFPPQPADMTPEEYFVSAQERAEKAVAAAGLFSGAPRLQADILAGLPPRPMQAAVTDVVLPEGPTLALIEDATGAGKTEAALILAGRMMTAGKGAGFYFALPTMATSNAMLSRLQDAAPRLFSGQPSLALTHGRADMSAAFQEIREGRADGISCSDWLADDRRRVLLADIGVGTIDQALMAVLPTRFSTLRLWALAGKVLVIDEAHSYDPYMEAELQALLRFQARLGGSAIVMTATLPAHMRAGFARAFQEGLGVKATPLHGQDYPQLSLVAQRGECQKVAPVPATCRRLAVHRLTDAAATVALMAGAAAGGAACVWVRNAVDDAIAAVALLQAAGVEADLLHARFTMQDRLQKETAVQARFGRKGTGRAGRVLVATQVVEASLDLDFDLMVSDLAPVGTLIQRAGRLWRHMEARPACTRPVPGPALHVLSPDPDAVEDARWLHKMLDGGAWVYPQDQQWRTARAIFDAGEIIVPEGLRGLIEAVYGGAPVPAALQAAELERIGRFASERAQAQNSLADAMQPYGQHQMEKVFDDLSFPTRLGQPQVTLRLARCADGKLVPLAGAGRFGWDLSEVQISKARYDKLGGVDQDEAMIKAAKAGWPQWMQDKVVLAVVDAAGGICEGLRYEQSTGLIFE